MPTPSAASARMINVMGLKSNCVAIAAPLVTAVEAAHEKRENVSR
ncbi:hypothetical protein O2E28_20435 [Escherichia coli]